MWLSRANFGVADKIHWMKSSDCQLDLAKKTLDKTQQALKSLGKAQRALQVTYLQWKDMECYL